MTNLIPMTYKLLVLSLKYVGIPKELHCQFRDPCSYGCKNISNNLKELCRWPPLNFVNPPYGKDEQGKPIIEKFLYKGIAEMKREENPTKIIVWLFPFNAHANYFQRLALPSFSTLIILTTQITFVGFSTPLAKTKPLCIMEFNRDKPSYNKSEGATLKMEMIDFLHEKRAVKFYWEWEKEMRL